MKLSPVGISDLAITVPAPFIESAEVIRQRSKGNPEQQASLERAVKHTGQVSVRFPEPWQDSAVLAAQVARELFLRDPDKRQGLRYLATGTETTVDQSKPISAYVQGMLEAADLALPESMTTFQIQHACAGGTISLFSVASMLAMSAASGLPGLSGAKENGLVICSDIARYLPGSTAEITQGAGSVAMLVETDPELVSLDISSAGYASRDVDDFFRPVGSQSARVKGRYSIRCYRESLEGAFLDYCKRSGEEPRSVLENADMFVLHVPYYSLPLDSLRWLMGKYLDKDRSALDTFLEEKGFQSSIAPAARIGNLYSGSMFMALSFLLHERYQKYGDDIAGKRILFASYGSGNTMLFFSGQVMPGAGTKIRNWDPERIYKEARPAGFAAYENWLQNNVFAEEYNEVLAEARAGIPDNQFFLKSIREDGYREYDFRK